MTSNDNIVTWAELIELAMAEHGERWADVVANSIANGGNFLTKFDCGFGGAEGCDFTIWTTNRVYFPTEYDGSEGVASAPRNPCDEVMEHV